MKHQIPVDPDAEVPPAGSTSPVRKLAPDLFSRRLAVVNVVFYGSNPGALKGSWVLIDAGIPGTAKIIMHPAGRCGFRINNFNVLVRSFSSSLPRIQICTIPLSATSHS
jgi:hypothetical protein